MYNTSERALYKSPKNGRRRALTQVGVSRERETAEKKFAIVFGIGRAAGAFNSAPFSALGPNGRAVL